MDHLEHKGACCGHLKRWIPGWDCYWEDQARSQPPAANKNPPMTSDLRTPPANQRPPSQIVVLGSVQFLIMNDLLKWHSSILHSNQVAIFISNIGWKFLVFRLLYFVTVLKWYNMIILLFCVNFNTLVVNTRTEVAGGRGTLAVSIIGVAIILLIIAGHTANIIG